jgi:type I restriction-modification system DNA methylase subunit
MINLFAIEIANTVDLNHKDQRNETYKRIAAKYKPEEFQQFGELFMILVESLERNPFQDFLGQMYMELDMGSKSHGQCFTPYGVCQLMAEMSMPEEKVKQTLDERGWISINDCACGAGATLIAAAEHLYLMGVNYQRSALFIAQDLDSTVAMMCFVQMSLIGCAGRVRIGDTLRNPDNSDVLLGDGSANTWYMPMFYSSPWQGRVMARWMDRLIGVHGIAPERDGKSPESGAKCQKSGAECSKECRFCQKSVPDARITDS